MIVRPVFSSHSHVSSTNASRPTSCRERPSFASSFSTTFCVAMPAWSYPGCQSVSKPRIRCQRINVSWIEPLSAWPRCSPPVTFGGGAQMTYVPSPRAPAPAAYRRSASHASCQRASTPLGSYRGSIARESRSTWCDGPRRQEGLGAARQGRREPQYLTYWGDGGRRLATFQPTMATSGSLRQVLLGRSRCGARQLGAAAPPRYRGQ